MAKAAHFHFELHDKYFRDNWSKQYLAENQVQLVLGIIL